jgi:hypothetical protein
VLGAWSSAIGLRFGVWGFCVFCQLWRMRQQNGIILLVMGARGRPSQRDGRKAEGGLIRLNCNVLRSLGFNLVRYCRQFRGKLCIFSVYFRYHSHC